MITKWTWLTHNFNSYPAWSNMKIYNPCKCQRNPLRMWRKKNNLRLKENLSLQTSLNNLLPYWVRLLCNFLLLLSSRNQRMIQHQTVLQCADTNPACVWYRGQRAHARMWFFQDNFETVFSPLKCIRAFPIQLDNDKRVLMSVKLRPIMSEWIRLSKLSSYILKLHGFQWVLLAAAAFEI